MILGQIELFGSNWFLVQIDFLDKVNPILFDSNFFLKPFKNCESSKS